MSFILGLTGGIGSGKSAASQWFESKNIVVVDADIIAREVVMPEQPTLTQIQKTFGCCRFVYNQTLAYRKNLYETEKESMNFVTIHR